MTVSGASGLWAAPSDGSAARGGAERAAGRGSAPAAVAAVAATVGVGGGEPWLRRPWLLGTLDWRR